jgi:hypothetical protein
MKAIKELIARIQEIGRWFFDEVMINFDDLVIEKRHIKHRPIRKTSFSYNYILTRKKNMPYMRRKY